MDQASVLPAASCARNPAALRTSSSCSRSADQSQTAAPPPARSAPQSEPHAVPSNRDPRPSSLALCRIEGKGYLLPDFYSGATGRPGRFSEGLLLRRLHGLGPRTGPEPFHAAAVVCGQKKPPTKRGAVGLDTPLGTRRRAHIMAPDSRSP